MTEKLSPTCHFHSSNSWRSSDREAHFERALYSAPVPVWSDNSWRCFSAFSSRVDSNRWSLSVYKDSSRPKTTWSVTVSKVICSGSSTATFPEDDYIVDCNVDSTTTFFKCRGADSCPFWIKALGEKLSAAPFSIETAAPEKCNVSTFFSTAWADKGSTVAVLSSTGPDSAGWRNSHPGNTISSKALHKRACSLLYSHLLSHTVCCCSYHSTKFT